MKKNPLLYCFFIFLLGVTLVDVVEGDKSFSDLENRKLSSSVNFTFKGYFNGSYPEKHEKYICDQFLLRDKWISLKSATEHLLGKLENNSVIYGKNDYLFEKVTDYTEDRYRKNVNAIKIFSDYVDTEVTLLISPTSSYVYKEYLPYGLDLINQEVLLSSLRTQLKGCRYINLVETFSQKKKEDIFYRTDHHWTSLGAYYAYEAYMNSMGEEAIDLNSLKKHEVANFYGTYFSKAKPFSVKADMMTYYDVPGITMEIDEERYNSLYDLSKLEFRDKYAMFLYGNNALSVIKNKNVHNGRKVAVIKDSYANSLVPFLAMSFEEVHVIDLRIFNDSPIEYVKKNDFNNVLINYNIINFTRDANIIKIKL